jgi:hypothetical protein
MCCFSRPVIAVNGTNIFARATSSERQALVYSMLLRTREELAMILPIPVRPHSGENAVRFINLKRYPNFFQDLERAFINDLGSKSASIPPPSGAARSPLAVVDVGSFEASFVPTIRDFDRLDERFRLPAGTWDQLPLYKNYGFTVFKLKPGAKVIHPMAFEFPRAQPHRLFFPTVHIHDGKVHDTAMFDHALYCQKMPGDTFSLAQWRESSVLAESFMKVEQSAGIVAPKTHCHQLQIRGRKKNADIWLG